VGQFGGGASDGTAITAGVAWRVRHATIAGVGLAGAYLAGVAPGLGGSGGAAAVGNMVSLTGFALIGAIIARHLVRQAETVRQATDDLLLERERAALVRERAAAERARDDERHRQYRLLHDTVLSTLNAIARGTNPADPLVRQRCAAEADLLRSMITGDDRPLSSLTTALAMVGHDQAGLGLRVQTHSADLPDDLPAPVIDALAGATREALNNVAKHAGTHEAWVTAWGEADGTVVVTTVDQGAGFDLDAVRAGVGLTQSIAARLDEIGGRYSVDSRPGEGCTVELRWHP